MMKVPHKTLQMEQMLAMANFFDSENAVYTDILPKLEELYKAKGLDITFAPKAFKLDSKKEPNSFCCPLFWWIRVTMLMWIT